MGFKFYKDSLRFICFLFFVALVGMVYCVYLYVNRGVSINNPALCILFIRICAYDTSSTVQGTSSFSGKVVFM